MIVRYADGGSLFFIFLLLPPGFVIAIKLQYLYNTRDAPYAYMHHTYKLYI